ncbi:hypothetical protein Tco_0040996 [Tanacetum coccineum]
MKSQDFNKNLMKDFTRHETDSMIFLGIPLMGFPELHQLDTFYNALNSNDQDSLNCRWRVAIVSKVSTSSSTPAVSSDVAELKDMVNQPPAYQAPVPQTHGVSKTDFDNYVKANDAVLRNMQNQGQTLQNQMANLTDMLSKFVTSNTASTSGSGTLPLPVTPSNPKEDLKGITTRSGVAYQGPAIPSTSSSPPKVMNRDTEVTKDTMLPTNNGSTEDVQPPVVQVQSQNPTSEPVVDPSNRYLLFRIIKIIHRNPEELKVVEAKIVKSSFDKPPEVELKDLPPHLEYAFLEGDDKLPVIIAKDLKDEKRQLLSSS